MVRTQEKIFSYLKLEFPNEDDESGHVMWNFVKFLISVDRTPYKCYSVDTKPRSTPLDNERN